MRKEGLEKLWDAFERLKTVESGADKLAQINALFNKSSTEPNLRKQIDEEGKLNWDWQQLHDQAHGDDQDADQSIGARRLPVSSYVRIDPAAFEEEWPQHLRLPLHTCSRFCSCQIPQSSTSVDCSDNPFLNAERHAHHQGAF